MNAKGLLNIVVGIVGLSIGLMGCQQPAGPSAIDTITAINERHASNFGNFDLPRKIGSVENVGLELPKISPDGKTMLYLRTDCDQLSPMTLLGSPDPNDTPSEGTLTIWLRPLRGSSAGRALSTARWSHSAVWSSDGRAVAYVVNEPPVSWIEHVDLAGGTRTMLGRKGAINCLPRFSSDNRTILFCSADAMSSPFQIYRQSLDQGDPTPMSPQSMDCMLAVLQQDDGRVIVATSQNDQIRWIAADSQGTTTLAEHCGGFDRPAIFQVWAGVIDPVSPDRQKFLFYDTNQSRMCVYHRPEKFVRSHRSDSIAACWLDDQAIALATADRIFLVNTQTGMSLELFNGSWIPGRYIGVDRKLILYGRENSRRFSIVEIQFHDRNVGTSENNHGDKP